VFCHAFAVLLSPDNATREWIENELAKKVPAAGPGLKPQLPNYPDFESDLRCATLTVTVLIVFFLILSATAGRRIFLVRVILLLIVLSAMLTLALLAPLLLALAGLSTLLVLDIICHCDTLPDLRNAASRP
jgi:hypothetical protein